jgi:NADPH:quinone reductase-like Zn-dependent oxidoreductase
MFGPQQGPSTSFYPQTRTAVIVHSRGKAIISNTEPIPPLQPDWLLIRTIAVSHNTSDWRNVYMSPKPGAIVGIDFAGIVEGVGSDFLDQWKLGDRVVGFHRGG